ncbi:PaaI family thioesterase [Parerythrobacter jejuensis]|uniref:Hotdog fold thioesterase n=1 Tax=Parerythrobacter jejuensis TaxID=795812 RepID=A0A845ANF8_9SPHN|nr:PaaI family thioesterase [Parerythrobacter jejuensis]MXP31820.1 hotdog fold thioesterase [Parerythrobacter jejuensis]
MANELSAITPYAASLGIAFNEWEDGVPILILGGENIVEGRPGFYHGGAISGLLETAGYAALRLALKAEEREVQLKPINITVQFLAPAKAAPLFAKARITKLGRRNANIAVECWQDQRERPRATAIMNVLLAEPEV